jgi:hypothetical protein
MFDVNSNNAKIYLFETGAVDFNNCTFNITAAGYLWRFGAAVGNAARSTFTNNVFKITGDSYAPFYVDDNGQGFIFENNTVYSTATISATYGFFEIKHSGDETGNDQCLIRNNIFYGVDYIAQENSDITSYNDSTEIYSYNCYYNSEDINGFGSIVADPLFVDAEAGDFHLKSYGWRWLWPGGGWLYDSQTSRCIDAGDPVYSLRNELMTIPRDPDNIWGHNLRINMGAYGGTAQASIPPYDWALLADSNNDMSPKIGSALCLIQWAILTGMVLLTLPTSLC